ncbi:unnamed protein product [Amoebophrya sp. A120]|nr:unnamed protein product [Amoebophrya sp. A120]|eukprot:GSA120T00024001001.1
MANESAKFMKNAYIGWTNTVGLHYGHDYDPEQVRKKDYEHKLRLKKMKLYKKEMIEISMIIPFTFICTTCGEFNYIGKKLRMEMEAIRGRIECGLQVYRFYAKCPNCHARFTFRTDPATQGYTLESGGKRTYEHGQDVAAGEELLEKNEKEAAQESDLKRIEQAAAQAADEMQMYNALEETMAIQRRGGRDRDAVISRALEALDFLYFAAQEQAEAEEQQAAAMDFEQYLEFMQLQRDEAREARRERIDWELGGGATGEGCSAKSAAQLGVKSDMFRQTVGPALAESAAQMKKNKTENRSDTGMFGNKADQVEEKPQLRDIRQKPKFQRKKQPGLGAGSSGIAAAARDRSPKRDAAVGAPPAKQPAGISGYSDSSDG